MTLPLAAPTKRDLFGGALTVELPPTLIDASDLRQVPDTQEVLLDPDSDVSLIFEILERVEPSDPVDAVKYHFDSIAHDNSAEASSVGAIDTLDGVKNVSREESIVPVMLQGTQTVSKFNRVALDNVLIFVTLYRVPSKNIDIVFHINIPDRQLQDAQEERRVQSWRDNYVAAARSLRIVDYSVFA